MERVWTTDLHRHAGERVRLAGWLHRLRRLSQVSFLVLRDGKGLAQVVAEEPALIERLAQIHHESVLLVEGLAVAEPQAHHYRLDFPRALGRDLPLIRTPAASPHLTFLPIPSYIIYGDLLY